MPKKLYELLDKALVKGEFGIEIECEGNNLYPLDNVYWKSVDDGSLRGVFPQSRCEWVLKKPLNEKTAIAALVNLSIKQKEYGAVPQFSFRTSVHVHVNVLDLTWKEYCNFIYLYLLFEEPLMKFCGDQRIGNRFCLRYQDAEGLYDTILHLFRVGPKALRAFHEDDVRYAAINLAATKKYGSLEFRGMRGTLDVDVLTLWIQTLKKLKTLAVEFESPLQILQWARELSNEQLCKDKLGDVFVYPGVEDDMNLSFSLTYDLPHLYKEFVEEPEEEDEIEKDEDKPVGNRFVGLIQEGGAGVFGPIGNGPVLVNNGNQIEVQW